MNLLTKKIRIYKWDISFVTLIWFLLALIGVLLKIRLGRDQIGNYLIYENVFWNAIHQINLYYVDPALHLGSYLYGPLFSIIIAPFSLLPTNLGCFLWNIANAFFLFLAIRKLPVSYKAQNIILLISVLEMMTSVQNMQINCFIAGLIIFSFIFVQKGKDFWATLFIAIGFLVKVYGIVGIAFFLFSRHKINFILSFIFWLIILICLPMLISSPSFVLHSYADWYQTLIVKDNANSFSDMQNISVMGMLRHIFKTEHLNLDIIVPAVLVYALPFLRVSQLKNIGFRMSYLALALIGVVIFSSSAESPTYIIAVSGVGIWYILQKPKDWPIVLLLIFTLLLTSVSSTDFFPRVLEVNYIRPYSLKALPCFLVWLVLAFQLLMKNFKDVKIP
ncbi:MAG TPA: glycosyltransferase family 87 protein [Hanamia sp.]